MLMNHEELLLCAVNPCTHHRRYGIIHIGSDKMKVIK